MKLTLFSFDLRRIFILILHYVSLVFEPWPFCSSVKSWYDHDNFFASMNIKFWVCYVTSKILFQAAIKRSLFKRELEDEFNENVTEPAESSFFEATESSLFEATQSKLDALDKVDKESS